MTGRPRPVVDDPDTAGFWAAAARHELAVCACATCERTIHLPLATCPACGVPTIWRVVAGAGRVVSWTVVTHQVHPGFPVPYTVLLVELDDAPGVRLVGRLDGNPPVDAGQAVRVRFEEVGDGVVLPLWDLLSPH